jgi:hypothetical protein
VPYFRVESPGEPKRLMLPRPIAGSISIRGQKRRSAGFKIPVKAGRDLTAIDTGGERLLPTYPLRYAAIRSEQLDYCLS